MGNRSRKLELVHDAEPVRLGELIHDAVRVAIERIVREELEAELGAAPYERAEVRHGYRNGTRYRTLARIARLAQRRSQPAHRAHGRRRPPGMVVNFDLEGVVAEAEVRGAPERAHDGAQVHADHVVRHRGASTGRRAGCRARGGRLVAIRVGEPTGRRRR